MTSESATYLTELHQLINQYFNLAEIRTLCLQLNVDYESVPGDEKSSRIRELLLSLGRQGRLPELITILQQERSNVAWPPVPEDFQLPDSLINVSKAVATNRYHIYGDFVQGDKIGGDKIAGDKITFEAGATAIYHQGLSSSEVTALVVELQQKDQPKVWDGRIPYLGLAAFQESDAQFFFGREGLVEDLLERVKKANFIVIAGPSGSGKSSVARAGLFHALREGRVEKSEGWLLATMQPKDNPIEQLALALERATKSTSVGDSLHPDNQPTPEILLRQIHMHLSDDRRERCVLLVDQFEETFTQTKDIAAQADFINLLTEATQVPNSRFTVILSLRSEFVSHCSRFPPLRELVNKQFQLVGAMEPHDLAKAITMPALKVGVEIDPSLVSRIVTDMKGEPGALPLMSFALRDLFEAEKTRKNEVMKITLAGYMQRGGIESALERHANQVFDDFANQQKTLARSIFSRLIEVGQGRVDTQRTATFQELIPASSSGEEVMVVINALAEEGARLIITDSLDGNEELGQAQTSQVTVTLAHEKLIDAWPWLRRLVDENREVIALQNQLNNDVRAWAAGKDAGFLYRGGRLLQVEEKLTLLQPHLDALSQRFIEASQAQRDAEQQAEADRIRQEEALKQERANSRRFRLLTRLLSVAALVALIATVVAVFLLIEANKAREEAEVAQNQAVQQRQIMSLMAQSQALMNDNLLANQAVAQARLMAVAAEQIDQEVTGGQNGSLLTPWNYQLTRASTASYQPIKTLSDNIGQILDVAWHPDGSRLASASWNNTVFIWDATSWELLTTLTGHEDRVTSVAWNFNGSRLASASDDNTIIIWDTESWEPLGSLTGHQNAVLSVAWRPDGDRLASASADGTVIIWQTVENQPDVWKPLSVLAGHQNAVEGVAWDPEGNRLASVSDDETIIIWQENGNQEDSMRLLTTLTGHVGSVIGVAWHPDGSRLASTSGFPENSIIIWDTASWELLATLTEHTGEVIKVAWHPDGTRLASASWDNSAIIWDTSNWQPLAMLTDHWGLVDSVAWKPDGSSLASASADNSIIIWDTTSWQPQSTLTDHENAVLSVAWSPDGSYLASASADGRIKIWRVDGNQLVNLQLLTTLTGHNDWVTSMAWHPDGGQLATASDDATVIIWDTTSWQPLTTLTGHTYEVSSVAWHPDGTRLATASPDPNIIIWNTSNWQPLTTLSNLPDTVADIAWHPDGSRLAAAIGVDTIIIWETTNWRELGTLTGHEDWLTSVAWSPDGNRLASASWDSTIIIWDPANRQKLVNLTSHSGGVSSLAWSPDGNRLASASADEDVIIWDTGLWQPLTTLTSHTEQVNSVSWHPDGILLASASNDNNVIITNYEDPNERNCMLARRNFSWDEWQRIFPDEPYRITCPQWPVHPSVPIRERPES